MPEVPSTRRSGAGGDTYSGPRGKLGRKYLSGYVVLGKDMMVLIEKKVHPD